MKTNRVFVWALALHGAIGTAASVRAEDGLVCGVYESTISLSISDLPYEHEPIPLCLSNAIRPDDNGLVGCRMFWSYHAAPDAKHYPTPKCSDYTFLEDFPGDELPSGGATERDHEHTRGPTCLVRQVTEAAADGGATGWHFKATAPLDCRNAAPAAIIPPQRPDFGWQIHTLLQCKTALAYDEESGRVLELRDQDDLAACAQPKQAPLAELGASCNPHLHISDQAPSIELGSTECLSGVCLTRPVPASTCIQPANSPPICSEDRGMTCTRRCAGEQSGDPGPFCACPDAFECKPVLTSYSATPELRGSYCFPR